MGTRSIVLEDSFRGGSGGRGFGGGSRLMRGVDEVEAPEDGVGFLEGEGVLLDSRMPFSLRTPAVSV